MKYIIFRLASFIVPLFIILPSIALAQKPVGIVTALKGSARLTRTGTQSALRFKDDLILRDIIDTQESSLVRVLFGGKSTVTVRELSRLEVREELLPGGGVRSVHNLTSGSILVNVARRLMGKGDEVVIRTPNAIGAVRGTIIFAQYNAASGQSTFVLLTGKAIVTPQGAFRTFSLRLQAVLETFTNGGGDLFVSGAYVGTDLNGPLSREEDRRFSEEVLRFKWRTDHASQSGWVSAPDDSFLPFGTIH